MKSFVIFIFYMKYIHNFACQSSIKDFTDVLFMLIRRDLHNNNPEEIFTADILYQMLL